MQNTTCTDRKLNKTNNVQYHQQQLFIRLQRKPTLTVFPILPLPTSLQHQSSDHGRENQSGLDSNFPIVHSFHRFVEERGFGCFTESLSNRQRLIVKTVSMRPVTREEISLKKICVSWKKDATHQGMAFVLKS